MMLTGCMQASSLKSGGFDCRHCGLHVDECVQEDDRYLQDERYKTDSEFTPTSNGKVLRTFARQTFVFSDKNNPATSSRHPKSVHSPPPQSHSSTNPSVFQDAPLSSARQPDLKSFTFHSSQPDQRVRDVVIYSVKTPSPRFSIRTVPRPVVCSSPSSSSATEISVDGEDMEYVEYDTGELSVDWPDFDPLSGEYKDEVSVDGPEISPNNSLNSASLRVYPVDVVEKREVSFGDGNLAGNAVVEDLTQIPIIFGTEIVISTKEKGSSPRNWDEKSEDSAYLQKRNRDERSEDSTSPRNWDETTDNSTPKRNRKLYHKKVSRVTETEEISSTRRSFALSKHKFPSESSIPRSLRGVSVTRYPKFHVEEDPIETVKVPEPYFTPKPRAASSDRMNESAGRYSVSNGPGLPAGSLQRNIDLYKLFYPDRVSKHGTLLTGSQHVPVVNGFVRSGNQFTPARSTPPPDQSGVRETVGVEQRRPAAVEIVVPSQHEYSVPVKRYNGVDSGRRLPLNQTNIQRRQPVVISLDGVQVQSVKPQKQLADYEFNHVKSGKNSPPADDGGRDSVLSGDRKTPTPDSLRKNPVKRRETEKQRIRKTDERFVTDLQPQVSTMPASTLTYALPRNTIVHNKISTSSAYHNDDARSEISSVTLPFSVGGTKVLYPNQKPGYASSKASSVSEFDNYPVSPSPSIPDSQLSYASRSSRRTHATIFLNDQDGTKKSTSKVDLTVASETGLPVDELRKYPELLEKQVRSGSASSSTSSRGVQKLTIKMLLTEKKSNGESTIASGDRTLIMQQQSTSKQSPPTTAHASAIPRRAASYSSRYQPRSLHNLSASEVELCRPEYLTMSDRIGFYEKRPQSTHSRAGRSDSRDEPEMEVFAKKPVPHRSYERLDIHNEDGGIITREVIEELKNNVVTVEVHEKGQNLSKARLEQVQQDEKNDSIKNAVDGAIGKAMDNTGTLALPDKPQSPPRSRRDKYELHQAMSWKRELELRPSNDRLSGQGPLDYQVVPQLESQQQQQQQQRPVSVREETRVAESRAISAPEQPRYEPPVTRVWNAEARRVPPRPVEEPRDVQNYMMSSTMSSSTASRSHVGYRSIFDKNYTEERVNELRKSAIDLRALADGAFDGSQKPDPNIPFTASQTTTTSAAKYDYSTPHGLTESAFNRRPLPAYGGTAERTPYSSGDFSYKFGKPDGSSTMSRYGSTLPPRETGLGKENEPVSNGYKGTYTPTTETGDRYRSSYQPTTATSAPYKPSYPPVDTTDWKSKYSTTKPSDTPSSYNPPKYYSSAFDKPPTSEPFKCTFPPRDPITTASTNYKRSYPPSEKIAADGTDSRKTEPGPIPPLRTSSSHFGEPLYKTISEKKTVTEETISKVIKTSTSHLETFQVPEVRGTEKDPQFKYITQYKSTPTLPTEPYKSTPALPTETYKPYVRDFDSYKPYERKTEPSRTDTFVRGRNAEPNRPETYVRDSESRPRPYEPYVRTEPTRTETHVRDSYGSKSAEPPKPEPKQSPVTVTYSTRASAFRAPEKTTREEPRSTGSSWAYGYKLPEEHFHVRTPSDTSSKGPPTKSVEPAILESLRTKKPSPPSSPDIRPKDWVPPCKAKILKAKRNYMNQLPPAAPPSRGDPWEKYKSGSRDKIQLRISQESLSAINREASRGSIRRDNRYSMPDLRGSQKTLADPAVYRSKIQWPEKEIQNKIRASQEYLSRNYEPDEYTTSSFANRWDARSRSLPPMSRYSKSAATTPIESPYPEYIDSDKAKSMEFLSDVKKYDYRIVPENQLQRENISGYSRKDDEKDDPYSDTVRKSLQKLDLPDWYVNSPYSQPGVMEGAILRNRAQSATESNYSPYTTLDRSELTSPTGTMHSSDAQVLSRRVLPEYSKVESKKNLSTSRENNVWDMYTSSYYNKKPSRPTPIYSPASETHARRYPKTDSGWSSDWNSHHESSPDSDESNTESRHSPRTWSGKVAPPVQTTSDWYKPPLADRRRDRSEPSRSTSSHHPEAYRESGPPPYTTRPSTYFDPEVSQKRVIQSTPWEVTSVKTETFKSERLAKKNFITETNDPVKIHQFSQESSQWGSYV